MIEDAMFLALGFFAAMLLALACIPILWARAMRLSRQRLELQVPLSAAEIGAERDGIRAEAAVSKRRLEQALEVSNQTAAERSAELGHRTVSLVNAERTVASLQAERMVLTAEVAALTRLGRNEEAQRVATEKALHDADAHIASLGLDLQEQRESSENLTRLAETRQAAITALEAEIVNLRSKIVARDSDVSHLTASLGLVRSSVAELTRERDTARNDALLAATRREIVEAQLKLEIARAQERDQRESAQAEARAREARMTDTHTANQGRSPLDDLKRQFDALQTRLSEPPTRSNDCRPGIDGEDRALRSAIVALGETALRQLGSVNAASRATGPLETSANGGGAHP